jgi:two-component system response regulator MprA
MPQKSTSQTAHAAPATQTAPAATILVVEDDPALAQTLRDILEAEGYAVHHAAGGAGARAALEGAPPDLILLDLMLPDVDGLVLCADLKSRSGAPIIVCSATARKRDSVLSLKLGADDFVAKPFDVDELLSRIEATLRRSRAAAAASDAASRAPTLISSAPSAAGRAMPVTGSTTVDGLTLEHARRRVTFHAQEVALTPTEYRLLAAFMSRPGEVLSRRDLAQLVWGYEDASVGRSIDVHVHRMRTKLHEAQERQGVAGPNVISVRGFGYKLMDAAEAQSAA